MSLYTQNLKVPSDIWEHLGLLRGLAAQSETVVELGFRTGISASAFLAGGSRLTSYDIDQKGTAPHVIRLAREYPSTFRFKHGDSRKVTIQDCTMLFIDTDHTYATTKCELDRHHPNVYRWIVLHDTETFGRKDRVPGKGKGIMGAVDDFLMPGGWDLLLQLPTCNGITILQRQR